MRDRAPPLQMEVTWDGVIATVTLTGELDITSAPGLAERLLKVVDAGPERLVLDLGGLVFVDVAGGRALDCAHKAAQAAGCPVIVRWPRPCASRVIQLAGFLGG